MKALLVVLMSCGLTFGLCGCEKKTPPEPPPVEEGETEAPAETPEAEPPAEAVE